MGVVPLFPAMVRLAVMISKWLLPVRVCWISLFLFIAEGEVRRDLKHMYEYIPGGVIHIFTLLYQLSMLLAVVYYH